MIEIWMLFSLLIPFIEVVLHTGRYFLLQKETEEKEISNDLDNSTFIKVATRKKSDQEQGMSKNNVMRMDNVISNMESEMSRFVI